MALDIHRTDNNELLFSLNDKQYNDLVDIVNEFKYRTGLLIDRYDDLVLSIDNQKLIINIIDNYIGKTDLNKNEQRTLTIIEFRSLLQIFSNQEILRQLK